LHSAYFKSQWFGISASVIVSLSIWLLSATVVHCSTVPDDILGTKFQCKQDSLGAYLIAFQKWPYDHAPFSGYWDSYDNKLAMIIEEPYSRLSLTVAMAYLIWFRVAVYARGRHTRQKKTQKVNQ
jgi:hypothetical protein